MGVINVTPDSFFDGGRYQAVDAAIARGLEVYAQGAEILDIGGESTRPGAQPVDSEEECKRVLPVIQALAKQTGAVISIDTSKVGVARQAVERGACMVNDVSAGRFDPSMASFIASSKVQVVLMHSRATPIDMQQSPAYVDVVQEVMGELQERIDVFLDAGVASSRIIIDPGIGFAKRLEDNIQILSHLDLFAGMGYELLVGTSRKSFIGHLTGRQAPDRLAGSLGSVAVAYQKGCRIFRVHDVAETKDFLTVLSACSREAAA